jgi:hypothetical protein
MVWQTPQSYLEKCQLIAVCMKKITIYLPLILVFLIAAASCESPRSPNYYTLEGCKSTVNYSTFRGQNTDTFLAIPVIPVLNGDMIVGEDFFHTARGGQNQTLHFSYTAGNVTLDGHLYALSISDLKNNVPAFSKTEIEKLEFLNVDEFPSEEQFRSLGKIAAVNKNVSINYSDLESDTTTEAYDQAFEKLLTLFDPLALSCIVNGKNGRLLEKEKKLEILMLSKEDSSSFKLPHISSLKTLIFINDSLENDFLNNNPQIENLSILSYSSVDTSILRDLPALRSLRFPFCGTLDLTPISSLQKLDRLILDGESISNVSALKELKMLRWLHLPNETMQEQFDSVISFHQKLELLEINGGVKIHDLSRIVDCKSLKGIIFYGDTMTEKKGLSKLTNLKYLSFPEESFTDSAYLALMKRNFPNTTIVPNSGVCLGSGWILLLIPLVLIFKFVYRDKTAAT